MAKQTGLGWTTFSVDDAGGTPVDIRNDVNSLNFSTPRAVIETTGLDKSAFERLLGLADFSVEPSGTFNPNLSHTVLATVPSSSVARTVSIGIGGKTLAAECLFVDYQLSRGDDGAFTWQTTGSLSDGTVPTWA